MKKQVMVIEYDGDRIRASHYCGGDERVVELHDFEQDDDFYYLCCYAIDEMAKPTPKSVEKGFFGRAICAETSKDTKFTVGKIYEFENGRTTDDNLEIFPREFKVGASMTARPCFFVNDTKFIIVREV